MDGAYAVALDSSGNPVVSGVTESDDFATTPSAFRTHRSGTVDVFVAKLSGDGSRVLWQRSYGGGDFDGFLAALSSDGARLCYGSYIGGEAHDILEGLDVRNESVYVSGLSASRNLPLKHSQIQRAYGGGPYDAILVGIDRPADPQCR
jgi:hypothetical protein